MSSGHRSDLRMSGVRYPCDYVHASGMVVMLPIGIFPWTMIVMPSVENTSSDAICWHIALDEDCDVIHEEIAPDDDFDISLDAFALGMICFSVDLPKCVIC
ncbi:Uncharacterized protein TCM_038683 [Theobroma cacao]|uniref:Uncharacterized protein n=1 Tax=Theobroma cacao TaxID=3641 RepID=A0A061GQM7_THECC|nr:Uncharacterized protein TCM_038683 [Theobroma cacao]